MEQGAVIIEKSSTGGITVAFSYTPLLVEKVKTIPDHRWNPKEKHWSFPGSNGTLGKILKVFEGEKIHLDPALQSQASNVVIARHPELVEGSKQSQGAFEDLRRELLSRKYSYKTVKGYLYYNRDFIQFSKKLPAEVNDNDIKDYLLYLAEERQSATATLNQAINALKFYYGSMLKQKFVYEVKRPRKDKKLPVVLSQEDVAKILSSVDNLKHKALLMLVYSAGLRVGEVVKLKPEDIDSKRMLVFLKGAKGRKDRYRVVYPT